MLDQFTVSKTNELTDLAQEPGGLLFKAPQKSNTPNEATEDFGKQLQDQMAALMGTVDESPEMRKEIEAMMQDLGATADPGLRTHGPNSFQGAGTHRGESSSTEEPFQQTIRKTMDRMQASGKHATAAKTDDSDDLFAEMFKEMQNGDLQGGSNDEGFNQMLMGMMEQLTNKDILYEPMKELHNKFPAWMVRNRGQNNAEDLERYQEQQKLVEKIVQRFENKDYSDSRAEDREFIVDHMQQVHVRVYEVHNLY